MNKCEFTDIAAQIDNLIGVNEHMEFLLNLLGNTNIPADRAEYFTGLLNSIEKRRNNNSLNLAVIGEFSSGKSTFINALLRTPLLKAALQATTASATYLNYGELFSVEVKFVDNSIITANENNFEKLKEIISTFQRNLQSSANLPHLIHAITTDHDVAPYVSNVNISFPSETLSKGLTIIDTPGIGAGVEYARHHALITEEVVNNHADIAIILIPATAAMSKTLIDFISFAANHFLHRCIFVVTKMDQIEEIEERKMINNHIRMKLNEILNKQAIIMESAAITMLPVKSVPERLQHEWEAWQKKFYEMEHFIVNEMLRQRALIIAERLVRLMIELMQNLSIDIDNRRKSISKKIQELSDKSISNLDSVLEKISMEGHSIINQQVQIIRQTINLEGNKFENKTKVRARELVNKAEWGTISDTVKITIPKYIGEEEQRFNDSVRREFIKLDNFCKTVSNNFAQEFEKQYNNLRAIETKINMPNITINYNAVSKNNLRSTNSFLINSEKEDETRAKWGASGGAALGFIIGGPLGALLGAGLGAFTSFFLGNSLDEHKSKVNATLIPELIEYTERCQKNKKSQLSSALTSITSDLRVAVNNHKEKYSEVVESMISEQNNNLSDLQKEQEQTDIYCMELDQRHKLLEETRIRLLVH
jgi:predicted GTPase/gas vesicle protein